jgi:phospholipid-translocating P-type ATPase (flippase)
LLALIDQQLKPNAIRTTKYTMLNWLPKSILEQFRRVANAYFLGISVLMILGSYATYLFISPLDPFSTIATLTVILLITSCKEGYEDLLRRRSDKYENNREVTVVTFEKDADGNTALRETVKKSKRLRPGDIVKLTGKMPAPADLLLILTSLHHDGNKCYVETANIDGETNLKLREAPSALCTELHEQIAEGAPVPELFRGTIEIEPPNANIHKFVGTLRLEAAQHPVPIDAQNIVLRSALFSNTDWAYGIVVYAGQETKIQMNSLHAPSKMSKLEKNLNTAIIIIFTAQVVLVSVSVLSVYLLGFNNTEDLPYVFPPGTGRGSVLPLWLELWFVFFLLYNNFIPLSLYVTIEIVNLGQSFLIGADREMYHEGLDVPCTVRASNLVQELGMVSNVFTDKTGTLTRNEMKMVKFVLNGTIYDVRPPSSAPSSAASTRPNTPTITHAPTSASAASDPALATPGADSSGVGLPRPPQSSSKPARRHVRLERDATCSSDSSSDSDGEARKDSNKRKGVTIDSRSAEPAAQAAEPAASDAADMFQLLRALMTCHSVVRESNGTYRAESPDELALVQGASESYDCSLVERGSREMTVRIAGREHSYAILAVNPFDADRKRMSVLLRDSASGQYMIVCKGADNIMLPLCAATTTALSKAGRARVEGALLQLANLGLRTLVVGQRYLDHAEAQDWLKRYRTSMVATTNRDAQIADTAALLERDLDLLGVTAIEDRLQDEVPEVISDLARAGIIVWMLTGDKLETAVNIGHSCNLVQATSQVVSIANMTSAEEFAAALKAEYEKVEALTAGASSSGAGGSSGGGGAQPPSERRNRRSSSVARGEAGNIVLILDGPSFSYFNGDDPAQCQQLLGIGRRCRSVIACRLTPMQKRELVALTKNDLTAVPKATTLSIGDGANDVSMILEANVGVGIFGKEGRQAANNADFAIGEFKFLRRLLLVHGRYNYIRQSRVFLYSMHKNMVLTMTLFWFR